jgi:DNA-binding XRE family transcriptional regulator
MKDARVSHRETFGPFVVLDDSTTAPTCQACGRSFIDLAAKQALELRAAQAVLQQVLHVPGVVLRGVRKALGLKQSELAELLDVRAETISRYESDEAPLPRAVQLAVADICARVERAHGDVNAARPLTSTSTTLRVA